MTRRDKRTYQVVSAIAGVVGLILAIVIVTGVGDAGSAPDDGPFARLRARDSATIGAASPATRALPPLSPPVARASQTLPPDAGSDLQRPTDRQATRTDRAGQTTELVIPVEAANRGDFSSPQTSSTFPERAVTFSAGRRTALDAAGGVLPGAGAFASGTGLAAPRNDTSAAEATGAQTLVQTTGGAHTAGSHLAAGSATSVTSAGVGVSETTARSLASSDSPSGALATPGQGSTSSGPIDKLPGLPGDVATANPALNPFVHGDLEAFVDTPSLSPDAAGGPAQLDTFVSSVADQLTSTFGSSSAPPVTAPAIAPSVNQNRIVNPEPATLLLLGTGIGLAARFVRRRKLPSTADR